MFFHKDLVKWQNNFGKEYIICNDIGTPTNRSKKAISMQNVKKGGLVCHKLHQ